MKTRFLTIVIAAICFSSCAGLTAVTVPCSPVNGDRDYETERFVEYTLQKTYVFGIGGLTAKARNTNVIDQLMIKANLKPNESLAYITVSKNINCYLGMVVIAKITASGYVIKHDSEAVEKQESPKPSTTNETLPTRMNYLEEYRDLQKEIINCGTFSELKALKKKIQKSALGEEQKRELMRSYNKIKKQVYQYM